MQKDMTKDINVLGQVEDTKALERTQEKELGKLIP